VAELKVLCATYADVILALILRRARYSSATNDCLVKGDIGKVPIRFRRDDRTEPLEVVAIQRRTDSLQV